VSSTASSRSPWVIGPIADRLLVIAAPFGCGAAVLALSIGFSSRTIWELVMTLGSVGHHLPGFLRTYGDRALFRRYRLRFLLAPPLFFGVTLLSVVRDLHGVALFSLCWSLWHGMMQHYGFLRVYDAKAGIAPKHWSRLDFALTASWFALCVAWGPSQIDSVLGGLLAATRWAPPAGVVHGIGWAAAGATAITTALYVLALAFARRRGRPVSANKLVLLASTTMLLLFARVVTTDPFLSIALFELLHDVQYLAIVWALNRRLHDEGVDLGRFGARVFGPGSAAAAAYVALCLGYGAIGLANNQWFAGALHQVLTAALVSSGLLHFYYDGFIWKVRERDVRRGLRLDEPPPPAAPVPSTATAWRRLAHPARYALPLAALLTLELRAAPRDALAEASLVTSLVPRSANAQTNLGAELVRRGQPSAAIAPLRAAVALAPDHPEARTQLGLALLMTGDPAGAREHLEAATRLESSVPENWINLGDADAATGELRAAANAYGKAVGLGADTLKVWQNLGTVLARLSRYVEAQEALERAAASDPSSPAPHLALGVVDDRLGRPADAIRELELAARLDPRNPEPLYDLGAVLEKLGRVDDAAAAYDGALARAPGFAPALQSRARLQTARAAR
jgi:Flp pilus assembly protein TadD